MRAFDAEDLVAGACDEIGFEGRGEIELRILDAAVVHGEVRHEVRPRDAEEREDERRSPCKSSS